MTYFTTLFGQHGSLQRSLIINISVALSLCITLATVVLISEFFEHLKENVNDALYREAYEIVGQIDPDQDTYGLNPASVRFSGVEGQYRYTVFNGTGVAIIGSETSPEIQAQITALELGSQTKISLLGDRTGIGLRAKIDGQDFIVLASTYPKGLEKTELEKLSHEVEEQIVWILLGVLTILAAAVLATKRSLRSLKPIQEQAQLIGPKATIKRLSMTQVPFEIAPLITAVNGAFDRLEKGYQAQRDFSSNVAHEVRTPLAVLRSSIEMIKDAQVKDTVREDVLRLDRMFEQMIDLSRADALGKSAHEQIDLKQLAVDVAMDMSTGALRDKKSLAVIGADQSFAIGNLGLIQIAVKNLVRNALIYSPIGTEVEIEVLENPSGIRILDRGEGIEKVQKLHLFERFHRGAATNGNTSGSGIGLAIVKSVADAHAAQINIHDRQGGGSIFELIFSRS
jgi:signal transduction histidine kinase